MLVLAGILLVPAGLVLMALGALLLVRMHTAEFWQVDRCLEAGGRYDVEAETCVFR